MALLIGPSFVSGFPVIDTVDKLLANVGFRRMHCKPKQEIPVYLNGKTVMVPCHVNNELAEYFASENHRKKVSF